MSEMEQRLSLGSAGSEDFTEVLFNKVQSA